MRDLLMLSGFTPPYTPSGTSSLVPPPPWHYAGQLISLAFRVDPSRAASLLPEGFGRATGHAAAHVCEWQATSDGSELLDPVYAQYKEFIVLIEAERAGHPAMYCPFIYVDQDVSMARGWMQGWPKKLGSIWMTRSYDLDHPAAAPLRPGVRFGASLAVKDRRLAEAVITLTGEPGQPIGFFRAPTFGLIGSPTLMGTPNAGHKTLVCATISTKIQGPIHAANGTLRLFDSPRDELSLLRPEGVTAATLSSFALSVTGARLA